MIRKERRRVVITTPKGQIVVARRLFDRLEAKIKPDDLALLRSYEWWMQLSELVNGIQFTTPARQKGW